MSNTKRCSGYKGHWECSEEYPDHRVPVEQFGPAGDVLDGRCRKCAKYRDGIRNPIANNKAPRHPETNQRRMNWLSDKAKEYYGGMPEYPKNDKRWKECRAMATKDSESIAWVTPATPKESVLPEPIRPAKVLPCPPPMKAHRFHDGKPRVKRRAVKKKPSERTGKYREGPGYVYIYQDERIPEDLKIGSSKTSYGRLNSAGTWGLYRCLGEYKFEKRYQAEDKVHESLAEYRLFANKEIFKVSFEEALNNILAIQHLLEDEDFYGIVDLGDADDA